MFIRRPILKKRMGKVVKVSGADSISKLTREHVVKIGDTLFNFDEVDSVEIDIHFKDGSTISYGSDNKQEIEFLSNLTDEGEGEE